MKLLAEPSGSRHRLAVLAGAIAIVSFVLLGIAARAHASETIFWDNYHAVPATIGFANLDGTGGGALNLASVAAPGTEVEVKSPEGLAYDPANGRIYIASSQSDEILWVSTDNSGAGVLDTGAVPVEDPEGIAIDPKTQTVYWANGETKGSIGYASAGGGGGGLLNTTGATTENPYKIALDTVNGRVYWVGHEGMASAGIVSYANLNGTGGGNLPIAEAERPKSWSAINVDPATGRLYLLGASPTTNDAIYWISTSGVGGGQLELEGPFFDDPYGLAFDPSTGLFYWANYGNKEERTNAFGIATQTPGQVAGITIATAPLNGPQDPVIVKSPVAKGAPRVSADGTKLTCSQGDWEPDYPGSYVYAAPLSFGYQWSKDGQAIGGANSSELTATQSGAYSCAVTGTNRSGSATQTSAGTTVTIAAPSPAPVAKPASLALKLASRKAIKVKAGKVAKVKIDVANGGGTASAPVKVCAKLTKKAKKGLKPPKCASVAAVAPGKTAVATLKVQAKPTAKGRYSFPVTVSGAASLTVTVKATAATPK